MQYVHPKIRHIIATLLAASCLLPVTSQGAPVTWEFIGNVVSTSYGAGTYWTDQGVVIGDQVSGRVTFDPDAAIGSANTGLDGFGGTFLNSSFNPAHATIHDIVIAGSSYIPGYSNTLSRLRSNLNTTNPNFAVPNSDPYDTFAIDNFDQGFQRFQVVRIVAQPPGSGLIPGTTFLSTPPNLADLLFGQNYVQELDSNGETSGLLSRWTSVKKVPGPGALGLLLIGLIAVRLLRPKLNTGIPG